MGTKIWRKMSGAEIKSAQVQSGRVSGRLGRAVVEGIQIGLIAGTRHGLRHHVIGESME